MSTTSSPDPTGIVPGPGVPSPNGSRQVWDGRFWAGLLWGEWLAHARMMLLFLALWLLAMWVLPRFAHPLWTLAFGGFFAVVAGPVLGGSDVMGGCEEYSFSMPITRRQRFDSRLLFATGWLVVFTLLNLQVLYPNLADLILSFFVSTGVATVDVRRPELLYGTVFAVPLAALAIGFTVASLATTRAVAYTAWVWAALGSLTGLRAGLSLEDFLWDRLNGRITIPLLLVTALVTLGIARRLYAEKEAGRASSPLRLPLSGWATLVAAAIGALGAGLLLSWFVASYFRGL
ncbi:MAG: hypothetical protein ACO3I0_02755 [Limisphaerales bacterium]